LAEKKSFQEGHQDLKQLAGLEVTAKQVERVSEQLGQQAESWRTKASLVGRFPFGRGAEGDSEILHRL
jgi:hypothetical protein